MARIVGIGHVGIRVRNLQRSVDFYQKMLGLRVVVLEEDFAALHLGDVHLCVVPGRPKKKLEFDLVADDLKGLHRRLGEAGVDVSKLSKDLHSNHEGFFFIDPDGHRVQVWAAHS